MTYEKQDITDSFYAGNKKKIEVTVYESDGETLKDLTNAEITYTMFTRNDYEVVIRKSSNNGDSEIKITGLGTFEVYLLSYDSLHLKGKYRHQANVVDQYEDEETIFTGVVEIHVAPSLRFRQSQNVSAYIEGVAA